MGVITFSKFKALQSGEMKFRNNPLNKGKRHDFIIKDEYCSFF